MFRIGKRQGPQVEDLMRALGYLFFLGWAVGFIILPPGTSVVNVLDSLTRVIWLSPVLFGSLAALIGALTRIDLKLEYPGIVFTLIGPIFYALVQVYFLIAPGDPNPSLSSLLYTAIPGILLLPRAYGLHREAKRLKKLNGSARP